MIISIQGNLGSYSHIASKYFFPEEISILERDTFKEVFEDLKTGKADYIVVPIENSTHGSVIQNFELFLEYNFKIIKEVFLKINFHLISFPDNNLEDIKTLYSHPVGLNQIKGFLRENPQIKAIEFPDTAGSVKMIKEKGLKDSAAAASRFAAELYGMKVIQESIQENKKNFTRFFLVSKVDLDKTVPGEYKTTLQFELGTESGSLYKALEPFATRDISLTKIESRPILHTDWEYVFFMDIMAGMHEQKMKEAFKELESRVKELKVLGSYKKGEYLDT